jgi:hypothetical protein
MATTTNYGWTTPNDTDLVKDGAAAIRTLGSSVDTTTKALNPSTTLGDIEYRSATANTNTRLGIGTSGQVLSVSGGVPAWVTASSGGMTLLSTTTLSGATVTISGISGSYNSLYAVITGVTNATGNGEFRIAPNNDATITNYAGWYAGNGAAPTTRGGQDGYLSLTNGLDLSRTETNNIWSLTINNYASTTSVKSFEVFGGANRTTDDDAYFYQGRIRTTSAITSLVFSNSGGNLSTGTVLLYGVK